MKLTKQQIRRVIREELENLDNQRCEQIHPNRLEKCEKELFHAGLHTIDNGQSQWIVKDGKVFTRWYDPSQGVHGQWHTRPVEAYKE